MFKYSSLAGLLAVSMCFPSANADNLALSNTLNVELLSSYEAPCDDDGCAEISAYDEDALHLFFTDASGNNLRILSVDETTGELSALQTIDLAPYGGGPNSVAVKNGIVAVAVEADVKQENGVIVLFTYDEASETYIQYSDAATSGVIEVGALPDMVTFTKDGKYIVVANEGEPNDDYTVDPEGSVSIIETAQWKVKTADFEDYIGHPVKGVRKFGPNANFAEDMEPEYIATSENSLFAWVSLQENNALARIHIPSARVTDIYPLGLKNHNLNKNAMDASNEDDAINIQKWNVYGMYQPDAITAFKHKNTNFIVTANEGDSRDYDGFSEEARVKDLVLNEKRFPNAEELQEDENLGRLKITTTKGSRHGNGEYDALFSYGARSFSVWTGTGKLVYDSGAEFETKLAEFEDEGYEVWVDSRSDDKGPEPESVTVGTLDSDRLAFIGLERVSGIFVYNLNYPTNPKYVDYINTKEAGDISPEGLIYVNHDVDTGWLFVTNEVSNTVSLYEITK